MHCADYEAEEATISPRERKRERRIVRVHTTMKERQKEGGEDTHGEGGLAVTQLRRRLIVSLAKTKGIWNNGQIGAFM